MRKIIFKYNKGFNDVVKETQEFEDDVTDKEIDNEFQDWVWNLIADYVTWYDEKEDD